MLFGQKLRLGLAKAHRAAAPPPCIRFMKKIHADEHEDRQPQAITLRKPDCSCGVASIRNLAGQENVPAAGGSSANASTVVQRGAGHQVGPVEYRGQGARDRVARRDRDPGGGKRRPSRVAQRANASPRSSARDLPPSVPKVTGPAARRPQRPPRTRERPRSRPASPRPARRGACRPRPPTPGRASAWSGAARGRYSAPATHCRAAARRRSCVSRSTSANPSRSMRRTPKSSVATRFRPPRPRVPPAPPGPGEASGRSREGQGVDPDLRKGRPRPGAVEGSDPHSRGRRRREPSASDEMAKSSRRSFRSGRIT
jgi:hypothetical protein